MAAAFWHRCHPRRSRNVSKMSNGSSPRFQSRRMPPAKTRQSDRRTQAVRPILKWAGGKRQLLPALRQFYPSQFDRYVEPFLGSGAVFLDCHNRGLLDGREVLLSDINAD